MNGLRFVILFLTTFYISALLSISYALSEECNSFLSTNERINTDFSEYLLASKAEQHIFNGDIARIKTPSNKTLYQISGGLHTYQGLTDFLSLRPDLKSLHRERETLNNWFHVSENSNGVLFVRLPSSAFTKKSLKSLWSSDLNLNRRMSATPLGFQKG